MPSLIFGIYLGWSTGMWQMSLLSLATAGVILVATWQRKRAQPLAADAQVYLAPGRAAIGDRVLPRWQLLWRPEWRERVVQHIQANWDAAAADSRFEQLRQTGFAVNQPGSPAAGLLICAGFASSEPTVLDLSKDGPHALVIGPTGVGKSQLLGLLLTSAISSNSNLRVVLADFKGGATLARFARETCCTGFITDLDETEIRRAFWSTVLQELTNRQTLFSLVGCSDIASFNEAAAPIPRVLVVIDELQAALLQDPKLADLLEALAARGRSLGIHLLVASQSTGGVPRGFVANLRLRFAVGSVDPLDLVQLGANSTSQVAMPSKPGWSRLRLLQIGEPARELVFPFGVAMPEQSPVRQSSAHAPELPER